MSARLPAALVVVAAFLLPACNPVYVSRAAWEEARILWRRQPIDRVLADPSLPAERRARLELVLDLRRFAAEDLALDVGGSYSSIAEADDSAIVHVLMAARRDKLERVTWWFPVVGSMPYKGFFQKAAAEAEAKDLEAQGYDTFVRPSMAFSTLGWFDDPLLTRLLALDGVSLADVVVHELFHQTVFVSGSADFNESAAVFVGGCGAIEYFCGKDAASDECTRAKASWQAEQTVSTSLAEATKKLKAFYASPPPEDRFFAERAKLLDAVAAELGVASATGRGKRLGEAKLNNAVLLHFQTYYRELGAFAALYAQEGTVKKSVEALREIADEGGAPFVKLRKRVGVPRP